MLRLILVLMCILVTAPVMAAYDDVTVTSVEKNSNDTVTIVANFSGSGEPVAQRSIVLSWNYTDDQITEWSVSTLEKLNGLKSINTRIKATDKLPIVRPVRPEVIP